MRPSTRLRMRGYEQFRSWRACRTMRTLCLRGEWFLLIIDLNSYRLPPARLRAGACGYEQIHFRSEVDMRFDLRANRGVIHDPRVRIDAHALKNIEWTWNVVR